MNLDNINFAELETKGFLIVQNFLNPAELNEIEIVYSGVKANYQSDGAINKNYPVLRGMIPNIVLTKARLLLGVINRRSNLKTNKICSRIADYLDNQLIQFGWHQDHESYFRWQNAYDDLNFWIPITKPVSTESGIEIIPQDVLAEVDFNLFNDYILGKGAKFFTTSNSTTTMDDTETGQVIKLLFNIDNIKTALDVSPGDLVLLRGDLIHRSQKPTTPRLAISFRAVNGNQIVSKEKFYSGSTEKHDMIQNNIKAFQRTIDLFEIKDHFVANEILS